MPGLCMRHPPERVSFRSSPGVLKSDEVSMQTRIIEYRGKTHASCPKCNQMVEIDPDDFKQNSPCPKTETVVVKFGTVEESRKITCPGQLVLVPIAKIWNGRRYDFEPKNVILDIPCENRKVCAVEDVAPDDNSVAFFDGLVKSKANNDWFWATDLEDVLADRGVLGAIERNAEAIRGLLGIKRLGRPKNDEKD